MKLLLKRGIVQETIETSGLPIYIKIDSFNETAIWNFKCLNVEKNDDVILAGYMGTDEYNDPIFSICAFFNISKRVKSTTKPQVIYAFFTSIGVLILTIIYWLCTKEVVITILISLMAAMGIFFTLYSLLAYHILEKEIKNLL